MKSLGQQWYYCVNSMATCHLHTGRHSTVTSNNSVTKFRVVDYFLPKYLESFHLCTPVLLTGCETKWNVSWVDAGFGWERHTSRVQREQLLMAEGPGQDSARLPSPISSRAECLGNVTIMWQHWLQDTEDRINVLSPVQGLCHPSRCLLPGRVRPVRLLILMAAQFK